MAARFAIFNMRGPTVSLARPVLHRSFCYSHTRPFLGLSQFFHIFVGKPCVLTASHPHASVFLRSFSARSVRKTESGSPFIHALRAATEVQLINSSMNGFFSYSSHAQEEQFQHSVLLVDFQGAKVGSMPLNQAFAQASAEKLHLSVVAASAVPPIVKLVSTDSIIANQNKKVAVDKESRAKKTLEKEIQMMMNIAPNDIQVKVAKILDFCQKGCRVLNTALFFGTALSHAIR
jgi:translation initiation factor IF-3